MKAFHRKRLLKLAEFLETVPEEEEFDIDWWRTDPLPHEQCGTAYCAVGWATTFPENRKAGLKLGSPKDGFVPKFKPQSEQDKRYCKAADAKEPALWKKAGAYLAGTAAERFFGLTDKQVNGLFYANPGKKQPTARQVAKRIRKGVEKATAAEVK